MVTNSLFEIIKDFETKNHVPSFPHGMDTSLQHWNDAIEQSFMANGGKRMISTIRKNDNARGNEVNQNEHGNSSAVSVQETANALHFFIVKVLAKIHESKKPSPSPWPPLSIVIEDEEGQKLHRTGGQVMLKDSNMLNIPNENDDANALTKSVLLLLMESTPRTDKTSFLAYSKDDNEGIGHHLIDILSQLIRASKNILRWNRIQLGRNKATRNHTSSSSRISVYGIDSCQRLCAPAMIQLYLLVIQTYSQQVQQLIQNTTESYAASISIRDDLTKNTLVILLHSTYGEAIEPISKKALQAFVSSKSDCYGLTIIAQLLTSSTSMQVMLALLKLVHNLVGSVPGIVTAIDSELSTIESMKSNPLSSVKSTKNEANMVSILVSTLAWSIRSKPSFPGSIHDTFDKRSEIVIEIVRILFAVRNRHITAYTKVSNANPDIMTQLGVIIVDLIHLPNKDRRVYECKVSVLMLLMDAPNEFSHFLFINHCIEPLLTILWIQLNDVIVEQDGMVQGQSRAVSILSILIVLNKLCLSKEEIKQVVKDEIFPANRDDEIMAQCEETNGRINDEKNAKNMNPLDAPPGTARYKLIRLMTWTESNVKRCASELLWTLCNKDSKEFVLRTGFGNAVHMLGIKGIVSIPKSN